MKHYLSAGSGAAIAGAAMLLSLGAIPAQAQTPGGSYLQTCTNVRGFGDRIVADCRRRDGSWDRTALGDLGSCAGDIANMNGQLTCSRGERAYGWDRHRFDRRFEGYGSSYDERYQPRRFDYNGYYGR